jgi:hypothetical protein
LFILILFCGAWNCFVDCFKNCRDGRFFCWVGGRLEVVRGLNGRQWVMWFSSFLDIFLVSICFYVKSQFEKCL